jgi:large subunit ribosomal protein L29
MRWACKEGHQAQSPSGEKPTAGTAMKIKEIKEKETSHLEHELVEKQKHLFALRSQAVTEKLENPSLLGKTRTDIARIKTVLRQRQTEAQKKA